MQKFLALFALIAALHCAPAPAMTLMIQDNGVIWSQSMGLPAIDAALQMSRVDMGARFVRIIFPRGYYSADFNADCAKLDYAVDRIRAHGMIPFLSLTYNEGNRNGNAPEPPGRYGSSTLWWYNDFGAWCRDIALRYSGRVQYFTIWNEPNVGNGPGMPPLTYHDVYDVGKNAIKNVWAGNYVYYGPLGAMSGTTIYGTPIQYFKDSLYVDSAWRPLGFTVYTDGLCFNPYQFKNAPSVQEGAASSGYGIGRIGDWHYYRNVTQQSGAFRNFQGGYAPMHITEFGYANPVTCPNQACPSPTEATRSAWIRDAWNMCTANGNIGLFCYYHLVNTDQQSWDSGIVSRAWARSSTFYSLAALTYSPGNYWYVSNSSTGTAPYTIFYFGSTYGNTMTPLSGDWDGDGTFTAGCVIGNTWYTTNSPTGSPWTSFGFGNPTGDKFITGDWDGNGTFTPGVVRGNTWILSNSANGAGPYIQFNYANPTGDRPVPGDWDGNGTWTPGIVRGNVWWLSNNFSGGGPYITFGYGNPTDRVITGDWDGNGTCTPGVVRGNVWWLSNSSTGVGVYSFGCGNPTDKVVAGDWDNNGTFTPALIR